MLFWWFVTENCIQDLRVREVLDKNLQTQFMAFYLTYISKNKIFFSSFFNFEKRERESIDYDNFIFFQQFRYDGVNFRKTYQKALLTLNLLLRNINDAHKEGDGLRTVECYRMALLYFKNFGHSKYAFAIMRLMCHLKYNLKNSHNLIFERFINIHGRPGKNIPMDLHLEHLNNFLKEQLKTLRSNLNEENAKRIAQAMNNIRELVMNTEQNLEIKRPSSCGQKRDYRGTVKKVAGEMKNQNPFVDDNTYKSYENFEYFSENLLSKQDTTRLLNWTKEKTNEFKTRIEIDKKKDTENIDFAISK